MPNDRVLAARRMRHAKLTPPVSRRAMDQLNYQHLLYFWTVAREGSVTRASEKLFLAPSTISSQVRALEEALEVQLFDRSNRRMVLTDMGQVVYRYAEEIFTIGQELMDTVHGHLVDRALKLEVGLANVVPKLVALKLIEPALEIEQDIQIVCRESRTDQLLADLALHRLDVVILDTTVPAETNIRAFNHLLGECGVTLFGAPELVKRHAQDFPRDLDGAPFLLPTRESSLRRMVDDWLDRHHLRPRIVGEFEDSALMKTFGQRGAGFFPSPSIIADEIESQYGVIAVSELDGLRERFYAVSVERRLKHPGVLALADTARDKVFG